MKVNDLHNMRVEEYKHGTEEGEKYRKVTFGTPNHPTCIVAYTNDDDYDTSEFVEFFQTAVRYASSKFVRERFRLERLELNPLDQMIISVAAERVTYEQEDK